MVAYEAKVFIYSLRFLKFTSVFVINVKINPPDITNKAAYLRFIKNGKMYENCTYNIIYDCSD